MLRHLILSAAFFWISWPALADNTSNVENVLECVDQKTPDRLLNGIDLAPARIIEMSQPYVFVHGALGWHTTWALLFDVTNDEVTAYETYGAEGDRTGAFGRMKVPKVLRKALVDCEVKWKGLWPNEWPEQRPQQISPPDEPADPMLRLPMDDLLPPPQ